MFEMYALPLGVLSAAHPLYFGDSRQVTIVPGVDRNEDFGLNELPKA